MGSILYIIHIPSRRLEKEGGEEGRVAQKGEKQHFTVWKRNRAVFETSLGVFAV